MKPLNQCWIKVWSQLSPELNRQIISQNNSSFYKLYTPVNNQIFAGILKQVRNPHPSIRSMIYDNTWASTRFLGQLRDQINESVQQNS